MFEKELSHLEMRKRMLVAESDINRTLFGREFDELSESFRETMMPVKNLGVLATGAVGLMGLLNRFRHKSAEEPPQRHSWLSLLRWGFAIWMGFRTKQNSGNGFISKALHSRT